MPRSRNSRRCKRIPVKPEDVVGWRLGKNRVSEVPGEDTRNSGSTRFRKVFDCCVEDGLAVEFEDSCGCAPNGDVTIFYDKDYLGAAIVNENFLQREVIGSWKGKSVPVYMKNGTREQASRSVSVNLILDREPDAVYRGYALVVRRRSVVYERNEWKKNGQIPDLVIGPFFFRDFRTERTECLHPKFEIFCDEDPDSNGPVAKAFGKEESRRA